MTNPNKKSDIIASTASSAVKSCAKCIHVLIYSHTVWCKKLFKRVGLKQVCGKFEENRGETRRG